MEKQDLCWESKLKQVLRELEAKGVSSVYFRLRQRERSDPEEISFLLGSCGRVEHVIFYIKDNLIEPRAVEDRMRMIYYQATKKLLRERMKEVMECFKKWRMLPVYTVRVDENLIRAHSKKSLFSKVLREITLCRVKGVEVEDVARVG